MNTELYIDTDFSAKGQHAFASNSQDKYSAFIDTIASKTHKNTPIITPAAKLFQESGNPIPTIKYVEATTIKPHSSQTINFNTILHNK